MRHQPAANMAVDTNRKANANPRALTKDRRMAALIVLRRRAVNRIAIDGNHTILLMLGSLALQ